MKTKTTLTSTQIAVALEVDVLEVYDAITLDRCWHPLPVLTVRNKAGQKAWRLSKQYYLGNCTYIPYIKTTISFSDTIANIKLCKKK